MTRNGFHFKCLHIHDYLSPFSPIRSPLLSLSLSLKCSINETHVKNPSKKEEKNCIFTFKTTFFLNKWRRPASATIALIHMFHEMHEEILMPEMSIIVNLHAKVGSLVHELCRPGMMVKAIIFATILDQTKCQILAMNAATFAVDFFPSLGL